MHDAEFAAFLDFLINGPQRDLHKHKCPNCENVWEHMTPGPEATEQEYDAAHTCVKCGTGPVREKYYWTIGRVKIEDEVPDNQYPPMFR